MNNSKVNYFAKPAEKRSDPDRESAEPAATAPVSHDELEECKYCGRRFAAERLCTHESICSKTGQKQRRVYDATKHRWQGTESEQYVVSKFGKSVSKAQKPTITPKPKSNWRTTHEEFIAISKSAKLAEIHLAKGGKVSDLPPPPPSSNPDYVQCPHCGRRFNVSAGERHIKQCATFDFNKPKPGAFTNSRQPAKPAGRKF